MPPHDLRGVATALAARLAQPHFGTGSLASLRRLDPGGGLAVPALQRLLAEEVPDHWNQNDWALVTHVLALAAPDLHRGGARFGAALQASGYSESRLLRLLQADRDMLTVALPRACRFLVAKGEKLNPADIASLVRAASSADDTLENARTEIARQYYRAERDTAPKSADQTQLIPVEET